MKTAALYRGVPLIYMKHENMNEPASQIATCFDCFLQLPPTSTACSDTNNTKKTLNSMLEMQQTCNCLDTEHVKCYNSVINYVLIDFEVAHKYGTHVDQMHARLHVFAETFAT